MARNNVSPNTNSPLAPRSPHSLQSPDQRALLVRRGLWLEYATLGWNVVGVGLVVWAAVLARSVALAGFGLDSLIEIFASVIVVWQLTGTHSERERPALRLIGGAFVALGLYILAQLVVTLLTRTHPAPSPLGIAWLALTLVLTPGYYLPGTPR